MFYKKNHKRKNQRNLQRRKRIWRNVKRRRLEDVDNSNKLKVKFDSDYEQFLIQLIESEIR